jgi:hypothetical protein
MIERLDVLSRYGVSSVDELEKKIKLPNTLPGKT